MADTVEHENEHNITQNSKMSYTRRQKSTIFVSVVTSFITTLMGSALNLAIPSIGDEFSVSASFVGWLITGYMLITATFSVPFGRLADLTDRKKVLVSGIGTFCVASAVATFAPNIMILLAMRMLQGLGGAMIFATNHAILVSAFPDNQRGKVLGFALSSTYIGLSAGPVLGGLITHYLGWRALFAITVAISAIAFVIAIKGLESKKNAVKGKGDLIGNALYILMILLTMYGLTEASSDIRALILVGVGLVIAVIFVRHELKTQSPVVEVSLFVKNSAYGLSNLATLMNYGANFATGYLLSIYLQVVMGYTPQIAGFILICTPTVMAVLTPYAGRLSDRISPYKMASVGMAICAAALLFFTFISEDTKLWTIIVALVVSGVGFATFSSPNTNAVMGCVEKSYYGVVTSVLATMRSLGHTLSMVVITMIVTMNMGRLSLTEAEPEVLIRTMRVAFIIFTITCVVGIFFSLKRNSGERDDKMHV